MNTLENENEYLYITGIMFEISENITIFPCHFEVAGVDVFTPEANTLQNLKCSCIIKIRMDQHWEILRIGMSEPLHLDLFYMQSGTLHLECSRGNFVVGSGEILILPSLLDRRVYIDGESKHIYIRFDDIKIFHEISGPIHHPTETISAIAFYVDELLNEHRFSAKIPEYRNHIFHLLWLLIQNDLSKESSSSSLRTEKVLQYLSQASKAELNVRALAKRCGMSLSAFRMFCAENLGKSPRNLIEDLRMSRAKGLLSYSEISIDNIAERVGYADRFAFSKAFTRLCSVSPVKYRKNNLL